MIISPTIGDVAPSGESPISPLTTTTYTLTATGAGGTATAEVTVGVDVPVDEPLINELVAINDNTIEDEDGDSSDWVEIHNPNSFAIDLGGYFLSDAPLTPTKWQFPAGTPLGGGAHLVVFASGKDRSLAGSELHTNFRLDSGGEGLVLFAPDGVTLASRIDYPEQISDIAYGIDDEGITRFLSPTPGEPNGGGFDGRVADTKFALTAASTMRHLASRSLARHRAPRSVSPPTVVNHPQPTAPATTARSMSRRPPPCVPPHSAKTFFPRTSTPTPTCSSATSSASLRTRLGLRPAGETVPPTMPWISASSMTPPTVTRSLTA